MTITAPTPAAVEILLTGAVNASLDATVQAFIDDASALVSLCACIDTLPDAVKTAIVKYLAAHLYTVQASGGAGAKTMEQLGDARVAWASPSTVGEGLKMTSYGQTALQYDTTGCLLGLGQKPLQFEVLTDKDC
jgi:hypothetical protein